MTLSKLGTALVAASLMSLGACAGVVQIDDHESAGFLTDEVYSKLEPTNDSVRAGLGYLNTSMDISRHDKILIDPVVSFVGENPTESLDAEDAQTLVNNFQVLLVNELGKDYQLVAAPGPNTLRVQVAMVRATKSSVALDTISTIVPVGVVATKLASYVTGEPSFTGQLKIEFEIRDADILDSFRPSISADGRFVAANSAAVGPDRSDVTMKLPDGLSEADWAGIRKVYSVERHRVEPLAGQAGVWHARNPGQAWRTRFDGRGFLVEPGTGGWAWGLELSRFGIGDAQHEVSGPAPVTTEATRVSYAWGVGLEEWFINDTRGLEHGFTLRERPGSGPGPLTLKLAVRGGLGPQTILVPGHGVAAWHLT